MSPGAAVSLGLGWLLVVLAPGYGAIRLLAPDAGRLRAVAVGPAVTLALTGIATLVAAWAGLAIPVIGAWAVVVLGLGASALGERRAMRMHAAPSPWRAAEMGSAAGGIAVILALWAASVQSVRPPNDDSMNHGWLVARILDTSSVEASGILVSDVQLGTPSADFYPLSWHALVGAITQVSGQSVAAALTVMVVLTSAVCLPLGMLAITRMLYPDHRWAAVFAPWVAGASATFPFGPIAWGGLVFLTVLCLVAAVVELLWWTVLKAESTWGRAAVTGLAVAGLGYGHPSVLAFAAVVLGLMVLVPQPSLRPRRVVLAGAAPTALIGALALAPMLPGLLAGAGERFLAESVAPIGWGQALLKVPLLAYAPTVPAASWLLALWGGAAYAVVRRLGLGWLGALVLMLVAEFALLVSAAPALLAVTSPWYSLAYRFAHQAFLLAIPVVSLGLAAGVVALLRFDPRLDTPARRAAVGALLAAIVLVPSWALSRGAIRTAYEESSVVGPDDVAAYAWMAERLALGERVLNDPYQGSGWMYPEAGALPVFGQKSLVWRSPDWTDRWRLLDQAPLIGADPTVTAIAEAWDVRFVFAGSGWLANHPKTLDLDSLSTASGLREVFRAGGAVVYERVPAG